MVNRAMGPLENQLRERHDASDFELRTQDKLEPEPQGCARALRRGAGRVVAAGPKRPKPSAANAIPPRQISAEQSILVLALRVCLPFTHLRGRDK